MELGGNSINAGALHEYTTFTVGVKSETEKL